ncbi:Elongation factor 2 [Orbilia oligospora]|nr:Elongation factor 2 [Orbilia oligospora]
MATSPNNLNKIYITVEPLGEAVSKAIEKGDIGANDDFKIRARKLADDYGWDVTEARKIWAFGLGPDDSVNMLVNQTKAILHLVEVRSHIIAAFQSITKEGPISGLPMRGVKFNIMDIVLADDPANMGANEIVETTRRAINASILLANPGLLESVHSATIQIPETASSIASDIITKRGGNIFSEVKAAGASPYTIEAYIPAKKSSGLETILQTAIKGQVSVQLVHDHWRPLEGDPLDPESQIRNLAIELRQEKGLPAEIPSAETYFDKA